MKGGKKGRGGKVRGRKEEEEEERKGEVEEEEEEKIRKKELLAKRGRVGRTNRAWERSETIDSIYSQTVA